MISTILKLIPFLVLSQCDGAMLPSPINAHLASIFNIGRRCHLGSEAVSHPVWQLKSVFVHRNGEFARLEWQCELDCKQATTARTELTVLARLHLSDAEVKSHRLGSIVSENNTLDAGIYVQAAPDQNPPQLLLTCIQKILTNASETDPSRFGTLKPLWLSDDELKFRLEKQHEEVPNRSVEKPALDRFHLRTHLRNVQHALRAEPSDGRAMTIATYSAVVLLLIAIVWLLGECTTLLQCTKSCVRADLRAHGPRRVLHALLSGVAPTTTTLSYKKDDDVETARELEEKYSHGTQDWRLQDLLEPSALISTISERQRATLVEALLITLLAYFCLVARAGFSPPLHTDTGRDIAYALDCASNVYCEARGVTASYIGVQGALWVYVEAWMLGAAALTVQQVYHACIALLAIGVTALFSVVRGLLGRRTAYCVAAAMCFVTPASNGMPVLWNPTLVPVCSVMVCVALLRVSSDSEKSLRFVALAGVWAGIASDLHLGASLFYPVWLLAISCVPHVPLIRGGVVFTLCMLLVPLLFSHIAVLENIIRLWERAWGQHLAMASVVVVPLLMLATRRLSSAILFRLERVERYAMSRRHVVGEQLPVRLMLVQTFIVSTVSIFGVALCALITSVLMSDRERAVNIVHHVARNWYSQIRNIAVASAFIAVLPAYLYEAVRLVAILPLTQTNSVCRALFRPSRTTRWFELLFMVKAAVVLYGSVRFSTGTRVPAAAVLVYTLWRTCVPAERRPALVQGAMRAVGLAFALIVVYSSLMFIASPCLYANLSFDGAARYARHNGWYSERLAIDAVRFNGANDTASRCFERQSLRTRTTNDRWTYADIDALADYLRSARPHWTFDDAAQYLILPQRPLALLSLGLVAFGRHGTLDGKPRVALDSRGARDAVLAFPSLRPVPALIRDRLRMLSRGYGSCGSLLVKPLGDAWPRSLLCVATHEQKVSLESADDGVSFDRTFDVDEEMRVGSMRSPGRRCVEVGGAGLLRGDSNAQISIGGDADESGWPSLRWNESLARLYDNNNVEARFYDDLSDLLPPGANATDDDSVALELLLYVRLAAPGDSARVTVVPHDGTFRFAGVLSSSSVARATLMDGDPLDFIRENPTGGMLRVSAEASRKDPLMLHVEHAGGSGRGAGERPIGAWVVFSSHQSLCGIHLQKGSGGGVLPFVYARIPRGLVVSGADALDSSSDVNTLFEVLKQLSAFDN